MASSPLSSHLFLQPPSSSPNSSLLVTAAGGPALFIGLVVAPASRALPLALSSAPSQPSPTPSTPSSPNGTPPQSFSTLPGTTSPHPTSPSISAFGTKSTSSTGRNSSGRRSSKRPSTSNAVLAQSAVPDGTKLLTLTQAIKAGRAAVTTFRSTSDVIDHLAQPISPASSSFNAPPLSTAPSSTTTKPSDLPIVVFLPLNDLSSALVYAANVLREAKHTPTALCFEEDYVSPSEKIEIAVAMSLEGIRTVSKDAKVREKGVVIVAYSASSSLPVEIIKRCERAGADLVVCSPYQTDTLLERIQNAILNTQAHPKRTSSLRLDTPSISSTGSPRPAPQDLLTLSDLSAPFANLCDVIVLPEENVSPSTARRASVDGVGMSMTLSRSGLGVEGEDGEGDGQEEGEGGAGGERKGPSRIFAELVAEMHLQVKIAIDVKMEEEGGDGVLGPIPLQQRNELINHLAGWSYRPYVLSQDDLFRCNCLLFEATLSIEGIWELDIDQDQIKRFLFSVKSLYHSPNPYHNYTHGSDVLQATYSFLVALGVAPPISTLLGTKGTRPAQPWKRPSTTHGRAAEVLRPQDVLTLMIAAIGHDGAHPGLSNAFLKNAKAPLSQVYEDKSALEHLHCILVVSLLKKHGFGWLFGSSSHSDPAAPDDDTHLDQTSSRPLPSLSAEAKAARAAVVDFRKLLFGTILATDMSMHFGWMSSLVEMGEQGGMGVGGLSLSEGAKERLAGKDRLMVLQALMKCADISNPARPVDISEYWSSALLDEWHQQATLEIGLALPVSVVKHADAGLQAKGQIAFQDLFVAPLFDATAVVMPELSPFAEQCSSNRALWFERLSKLTAPDATSKPRSRLSPTSPAAQASPLPSHPDEDVAPAFPIPCPMNSRYRSLFPLTLPPALIALPTSPSRESFENEQPNGKSLLGTPRHHEHVPQRELSATSLAGARGGEGAGALKVAYASGEEARRR